MRIWHIRVLLLPPSCPRVGKVIGKLTEGALHVQGTRFPKASPERLISAIARYVCRLAIENSFVTTGGALARLQGDRYGQNSRRHRDRCW